MIGKLPKYSVFTVQLSVYSLLQSTEFTLVLCKCHQHYGGTSAQLVLWCSGPSHSHGSTILHTTLLWTQNQNKPDLE